MTEWEKEQIIRQQIKEIGDCDSWTVWFIREWVNATDAILSAPEPKREIKIRDINIWRS